MSLSLSLSLLSYGSIESLGEMKKRRKKKPCLLHLEDLYQATETGELDRALVVVIVIVIVIVIVRIRVRSRLFLSSSALFSSSLGRLIFKHRTLRSHMTSHADLYVYI